MKTEDGNWAAKEGWSNRKQVVSANVSTSVTTIS